MARIQTPMYTMFQEEDVALAKPQSVKRFGKYLGIWDYLNGVEVKGFSTSPSYQGDIVFYKGNFYKALFNEASFTVTYDTTPPDEALGAWTQFTPYITYAIAYEDLNKLYSVAQYIPIDSSVSVDDPAGADNFRTVVLSLLPCEFSDAVDNLAVFRRLESDDEFYYIGKTESKKRFLFEDNGLPRQFAMPDMNPDIEYYPDSIRWTTVGSSTQIPFAALENVQFGDGDTITGMAVLYGNLIVFKENSIHRLSFNGADVNFPISRTDIVSPDIGCIAPRTILTVNNTVYFLSWQGFYSYDNNQLRAIDGPVSVELRQRLHTIRESWKEEEDDVYTNYKVKSPDILLCSTGFNQKHNEIYLNVPIRFNPLAVNAPDVPDGNIFNGIQSWQSTNYAPADGAFDEYSNYPCVYVFNIDGSYVTKFIYGGTNVAHAYSHARLYCTNSIGELRSGRVTPGYGDTAGFTNAYSTSPAEIFLESPTDIYVDAYLSPNVPLSTPIGGNADRRALRAIYPSKVPDTIRPTTEPIMAIARSKFFGSTGDNYKFRMRKLLLEWVRTLEHQRQAVYFLTYPFIYRDFKLDDFEKRPMIQSFTNIGSSKFTTGNLMSFTPREVRRDLTKWLEVANNPLDRGTDEYGYIQNRRDDYQGFDNLIEDDYAWETQPLIATEPPNFDDIIGKPIHFAFDVVAIGRSELLGYSIYTRPIHTYLG